MNDMQHSAAGKERYAPSLPVDPVIRRATVADAETIAPLWALEAALQERLGGYSLTEGFDWGAFCAQRLGAAGHVILVAERDGEVVGYVYGRSRSAAGPRPAGIGTWLRRMLMAIGDLPRRRRLPPASPACFDGWGIIEGLYIVEAERRQRLATRLVASVKRELGAMGVTRIEVSVMVANEPAMAFWASQGFGWFRVHLVAKIENDHPPVTNRADEPGSQPRRGR